MNEPNITLDQIDAALKEVLIEFTQSTDDIENTLVVSAEGHFVESTTSLASVEDATKWIDLLLLHQGGYEQLGKQMDFVMHQRTVMLFDAGMLFMAPLPGGHVFALFTNKQANLGMMWSQVALYLPRIEALFGKDTPAVG